MTEPMDFGESSKQESVDNNADFRSSIKPEEGVIEFDDIKPILEKLISNTPGNSPKRVKETEQNSSLKEKNVGAADNSTVISEMKKEPAISEVPVGSSDQPSVSTTAAPTSQGGHFASLQSYMAEISPSHALKSFRDNLTSAYSLDEPTPTVKTTANRKHIDADKPSTIPTTVNVDEAVNVPGEFVPLSSIPETLTGTVEVEPDGENLTELSSIETSTAMTFSEGGTQPSPAPTDSSLSTLGGGEKSKKRKQVSRKTTASSPVAALSPSLSSVLYSPSVAAELERLKFANPGRMNEEISLNWNHGNVTRGFRRQHTRNLQPASANGSVSGSETAESASNNWTQEEGYMARGQVKQMEMHDQLCRTNSSDPLLFDQRGLFLETAEDRCDCMRPDCPGCFLPCRRCHKNKCGPLCRIRRNFQYEPVCLALCVNLCFEA